ncbi:M48 family metalloprotease [Sphingomonas mollis]|uniref:M48 family metalloprotease n=1 Tax=Sphingomonas mollis TaxID=2795726 RepID=A0ABS0XJU7_9SPHN|nr:M48 family metalloprotease [Sphingomonas sp. BT553]MBJ6120308.1 M48 family metalloprotease [Sphingomonas sp. BT553]
MKRSAARLPALLIGALLWAQPAAAQSILRDAETESMFQDMSTGIVKAAGLDPRHVKVVLINDDSINAFVVGGQVVYVHSGLIQAADNANEVQGVIAHELGHIADGHVISGAAAQKPALAMTILSMVLGLGAMAAGGGAAGAGIMAMGQQAAMGQYLAFNRTQEATADASAIRYLATAGLSGRGMLTFFKKLQRQELRYRGQIDPFMQSHPLSGERIANLTADVQASPAYNAKPDPALDDRFRRVKAKLEGFVMPPERTLQDYPETDRTIYGHYARAYAYHKGGYPDKADAEANALVAAKPNDPYFQEIQGQILLEAGRPRDALVPLRAATEGSRNNPLIATTFGHALIATEDKANVPEAIRVLRVATQRDDDNPWAWMQLGTAYELTGDEARAALATAERASMMGDARTAVASAKYAMANIPANTPDWIRAQDIAMTSGDAAANQKRKRR